MVLLAAVFTSGCGAPRSTDPVRARELSFLTRDGARLVGTLYTPERAGPAGLILVHSRGGSRSDFQSFARQAQGDGYMSIAFDLRGHGDSRTPPGVASGYREFQTSDWLDALNDIDAAKVALVNAGADPENLAMVGAGVGANLALTYAANHDEIQAVVLLSPGRVEEGISAADALRQYGRRPVLIMVTTGDTLGLVSGQALSEVAPGHCEIREYDGTARGTAIFDTAVTSSGQVLLWFSGIIGPDSARRNRELEGETRDRAP